MNTSTRGRIDKAVLRQGFCFPTIHGTHLIWGCLHESNPWLLTPTTSFPVIYTANSWFARYVITDMCVVLCLESLGRGCIGYSPAASGSIGYCFGITKRFKTVFWFCSLRIPELEQTLNSLCSRHQGPLDFPAKGRSMAHRINWNIYSVGRNTHKPEIVELI